MLIIDLFPSLREVQSATAEQIVAWHVRLRPTMFNEELPVVKAIARRYDALPEGTRTPLTIRERQR
jgi:hypothetical protein